ncbi:hypothetical protein HGT71_15530 [Rosenbergiella epipactidis]|uniref:hypothetical protein n=1 Tax=Rosenbergiella epipactidis TaxID=1544694 RepID=UPI001BD9FDE8|nr:hypothetical protein [Rosenbergiella epipactidis]MBT0719654.1 hypothetical protein [Rosenbergiella epipactidis]
MTKKAEQAGKKILDQRRLELRNQIWGNEVENLTIWDPSRYKGFAYIPRHLPQVSRIMDKLAGTGKPVSGVYLSLLCNVFSHGFIEVKDKKRLAFESGFSGPRALTTWHSRMKKLEELGFIQTKSGTHDEFSYVLVIDPLNVIKNIYESKGKDALYNSLVSRMNEIGTVL